MLLTLDSVISWSLMMRRYHPHASKQNVGISVLYVFNFVIFFFLKETFWNEMR